MSVLRLVAYIHDIFFFFFQAEDGIRDLTVTGVQTCALPILVRASSEDLPAARPGSQRRVCPARHGHGLSPGGPVRRGRWALREGAQDLPRGQIGRASCRERV